MVRNNKSYQERVKMVEDKNTDALGNLGLLVNKDYKSSVLQMVSVTQAWKYFETFYAPGGDKTKAGF